MTDAITQNDIQRAKTTNEEEGRRRLPIYFVLDTSYSMSQFDRIDAVKRQVPIVLQRLSSDPELDNKVRVTILDMSGDTTVLQSMRRPSELPSTFDVTPSGGTNYTSAFEILRTEIEKDYSGFTADKVFVFRAAVIFLTDGEPVCAKSNRDAAFTQLTDPTWKRYPYLIMVGVGKGVNARTLNDYAFPSDALLKAKPELKELIKDSNNKPFRIHIEDDQVSASTITELIGSLIRSIVNSGASAPPPSNSHEPRELDIATLLSDTARAAASSVDLPDDDQF